MAVALQPHNFPYSDVPGDNTTGTRGISNQTRGSLIDDKMRAAWASIRQSLDTNQNNLTAMNAVLTSLEDGTGTVDLTSGTIDALTSDSVTTDSVATGSLTVSGTATIGVNTIDNLPSGTRQLWQQATAPIGWTTLTDNDNAALRVVSSNPATGGTMDFTDAFAASRDTNGTLSGNTDEHTLTVDETPSHSHYTVSNSEGGGGAFAGSSNPVAQRSNFAGQSQLRPDQNYFLQRAVTPHGGSAPVADTGSTNAVGGGEGHSHGLSASVSTSFALGVKYVDVIAAEKD